MRAKDYKQMGCSDDVAQAFAESDAYMSAARFHAAAEVAARVDADMTQATVDYVSLQDYESAIESLGEVDGDDEFYGLKLAEEHGYISPLGRAWREHAIGHLYDKVDAYFRDRPVIRDGKAAAAYISMFGEHLTAASEALKQASERLLRAGDGFGARQAREAHIRVRQAAEELTGTE